MHYKISSQSKARHQNRPILIRKFWPKWQKWKKNKKNSKTNKIQFWLKSPLSSPMPSLSPPRPLPSNPSLSRKLGLKRLSQTARRISLTRWLNGNPTLSKKSRKHSKHPRIQPSKHLFEKKKR